MNAMLREGSQAKLSLAVILPVLQWHIHSHEKNGSDEIHSFDLGK